MCGNFLCEIHVGLSNNSVFFIISNGITIWIIQFGIGISNAFKGIHIPIELHSRANVYEIAKRNVKKRIQFKFQMHAQFERQLS